MKIPILLSSVTALLLLLSYSYAQQNRVTIDLDLSRWTEREFRGNTDYQLGAEGDDLVLIAEANGAASALYQENSVDLDEFPILDWSWRVDPGEFFTTAGIDETSRAGDDFAARIYIVRRGGIKFWQTRSINYVWSRSQDVDRRWYNPYSEGNQIMWSVNRGESDEWESHSRNIREDWKIAFNEDISSIDGIALMTDSDNTGLVVRAKFKGIEFSDSREKP